MSEIKIGEYIRTLDGKIGKFVRYSSRKDDSIYKSPFNCFIKLENRKSVLQCHREYIVKHSKNIIDLIEVGDIVEYKKGKYKVKADVFEDEGKLVVDDLIDLKSIRKIKIISILTKEKFEEESYKVGE